MATKKATKKSKGGLSKLRRVHQVILNNLTASVMIASLLLNAFFLTGIVLFHSSSSFQEKVTRYSTANYCDDLPDGMAESDYDVVCLRGQFKPYYDKAISEYQDLLNRQNY